MDKFSRIGKVAEFCANEPFSIFTRQIFAKKGKIRKSLFREKLIRLKYLRSNLLLIYVANGDFQKWIVTPCVENINIFEFNPNFSLTFLFPSLKFPLISLTMMNKFLSRKAQWKPFQGVIIDFLLMDIPSYLQYYDLACPGLCQIEILYIKKVCMNVHEKKINNYQNSFIKEMILKNLPRSLFIMILAVISNFYHREIGIFQS